MDNRLALQFLPGRHGLRSVEARGFSGHRVPAYLQNRFLLGRNKQLTLAAHMIVVAVMALPVIVFISDAGRVPMSRMVLGCIICALGSLPAILYLRNPERSPVPLLPLTGLFYLVSCGLPAFHNFSTPRLADVWHSEPGIKAFTTVIYALSSLYAGYYFSPAFGFFRNTSHMSLPRRFPRQRLIILLWTLLMLNLAALIFREEVIRSHLDQVLLPLGYFSCGMLLILWRRRCLGAIQKLVFIGFVVAEMTARFATGSIATLYLFLLFLMIVVWIERQRVPLPPVAAGLVLFTIFNYGKMEYRALTWGSGPFADAGIVQKAILFGEISFHPSASAGGDFANPAIDALTSRVSVVAFLSQVIDQTPEVVPFWNGETYAGLPYKLIPRIVWPDKPAEVLGYEFSRRYGLRSSSDESTSFNVPWIVEMYANFGPAGVVGGMLLVGLLYAWIEQKLNRRSMTTLELMLGATVLFDLFYQESNFSLMVGSKILFTPLLYLAIRAILSSGRRSAADPLVAPRVVSSV